MQIHGCPVSRQMMCGPKSAVSKIPRGIHRVSLAPKNLKRTHIENIFLSLVALLGLHTIAGYSSTQTASGPNRSPLENGQHGAEEFRDIPAIFAKGAQWFNDIVLLLQGNWGGGE